MRVSTLARVLLSVTAAAFGLMGLVLFVAPAWSAANFSWKISPFVAMTMGGWYLGSAVLTGLAAYYGRWKLVYAPVLYTAFFSLAEALVLVIHASRLNLAALLAWPYIGMLALAIVAALVALADWLRQGPSLAGEGAPVPRWLHLIDLVFVVFVFSLSVVAFSGHWVGLQGGVFPEPLSLFTLHSFGAFYFSLACSAVPLLWARYMGPVTVQIQGGLSLIVAITAAIFAYFDVFNLAERRFQWIYLGAYLIALGLASFILWQTRARRTAVAATA